MALYEEKLEEIEDEEFEDSVDDEAAVYADDEDILVDFTGRGPSGGDEEEDESHDANLAEKIDSNDRISFGTTVVTWVEDDEQSRQKWKNRLRQGLELIGVEDIPSNTAAFDGASTVNHPAIAEAMTRFQANAIEELFPAEGPVKTKVIGASSPEREEQSVRVQDFMNYQLTEEDDEYFEHTDQMLMYLPFSGSAFKKVYYDHTEERSLSRFVDAEHFIVPYDATSLKTAPRYTHWYTLTKNEVAAKIASGEFIETDALDPSGRTTVRDTQSKEMKDISDDRDPSRADDDVSYDFYEVHIETSFAEFDQEGDDEDEFVALPYVVTIEKESGEIMAIRRLWKEGDPKRKKRVHFIHYKFLPGLGFYGWGYLHIIGSLGKAASGALRALLDGSATASLQGGFKSREAKVSGDFVFTPGEWKDVDMTAEDLAKSFYTPPFKEPSPALFKTLEILVQGIQNFSSTMEAMTGAADNKGPVGTTLALIEQGSKIYSAIHKRLHKAAKMEFKLLAQLNFEYLEDYPYEVAGGQRNILKSDFDGRVDILPVSDPNIFSNVQRIALAQAVIELVNGSPDVYDAEAKRLAHLEMLKALRVPFADMLLPKKKTKRLDPVTENQIILTGGAVEAYVEQDHAAHIQVHMLFIQEMAGSGLDPALLQSAMLNMQAHLAQHHAYGYRLRIEQQLQAELPDTDFKSVRDEEDVPIEIDNAVARAVAANVAPPPPAQGPEPDELAMEQQKHEQKLKHDDENHQAKLRRDDEAHQNELRRKKEAHDQDMQNERERAEIDNRKAMAKGMIDSAKQAASLKDQ